MRITSKGQVTIPQDIREALGLHPNTEVEFTLDKDGVRLTKARRPGARSVARQHIDRMRGTLKTGMSTDELMKLLRD
jgi:AbrB family looped-hinge helix DNA binding protein